MADKSFADLLREAGVQPSGAIQYAQSLNRPVPYRSYTPPRPLPRRMRPADVRAYDDNAGVAQQALSEMRRDRMTGQDAMLREAQGPASNQFADAGMVALETTGVPALRRSYDAFEAGDPGQGIYEGIWGGLGLAGTLGAIPGARRTPRLPTREPALPQMREPPAPPPGSVLPVRPPQPFRQSLIGGADDLTGASRGVFSEGPPDGMPPRAPDAGAGRGGQPLEGEVLGPTSNDVAPRERMSGRDFLSRTLENGVNPFRIIDENTLVDLQNTINQRHAYGRPAPPPSAASGAETLGAGILPREVYDLPQTTVYRNPSERDIFKLLGTRSGSDEYSSARAIIDRDGNVFVFRGWDAIHDDVAITLRRSTGNSLPGYRLETDRINGELPTTEELAPNRGGFFREGEQLFYSQGPDAPAVPAREVLRPLLHRTPAPPDGSSVVASNGGRPPSLTPAVRVNGRIYEGETHLSALSEVPDAERAAAQLDGRNRGYVDDRGRFINNERATEYARNFGLIKPEFEKWAQSGTEIPSEWMVVRSPRTAPTAGPSRPPPDTAKSYRPGPPKGGFFFSRRR